MQHNMVSIHWAAVLPDAARCPCGDQWESRQQTRRRHLGSESVVQQSALHSAEQQPDTPCQTDKNWSAVAP